LSTMREFHHDQPLDYVTEVTVVVDGRDTSHYEFASQ